MSAWDGVNTQAVDCPTCDRKAGQPCARKAEKNEVRGKVLIRKGEWIDASQRVHPDRRTAAIRKATLGHRGGA
jgi:hypothetical protein